MNEITANDTLQSVLLPLKKLTEIRDPDGNLLGYFAPASERQRLLYQQAAGQFDPEEIARRKTTKQQDYSFDEVMQHLNALEEK